MYQNLNNPSSSRPDYGAISSSSTNVPAVEFVQFSPTEFMSLSEDIAHNICAVNSAIKHLEKILKNIANGKSSRDQVGIREKVHTINGKTNSRIEATGRDLQRLTSVVGHGDKQQKLQLIKLTTEFKNVVNKYSDVQQRVAAAMKKSYLVSTILQEEDEDADADREYAQQQQQMQINANLEMKQEELIQRATAIKQIETDMLDVNAIMCTLSNLLQAQREQTNIIEANVESGASNVEAGLSELTKAAASRSGYRKKMLILLIIAVIVGIIITTILIQKLKV